MRRVVFSMESGFVGASRKEIVEFLDDTTDDEIEQEFETWLGQYGCWYELEDGDDGEDDEW